jgi:hypothetical protein
MSEISLNKQLSRAVDNYNVYSCMHDLLNTKLPHIRYSLCHYNYQVSRCNDGLQSFYFGPQFTYQLHIGILQRTTKV